MQQFDRSLSQVIDSTLRVRCKFYGYQYSEILRSLMCIYFCGGSCVEDLSSHLINHLSLHPKLRTCNADTILRAISELAQSNISYASDAGKKYAFNTAERLNELMLNCLITPPNGLLLYGPPGCGKSFFAEKFAEETGYNFMLVKSSDLVCGIHHSTEMRIKNLFELAAKNAPIVICFDEFDALVPDRGARGNEYEAKEVNEMLAQLNNCSKRGIFVVASTNRPDKIDPAVKRTGRIDKMYYVPLPDLEARKEMFRMYLKDRPVADNLDIDYFAKATEGYIASDIAYIVNDAAMVAAYSKQQITKDLLQSTLDAVPPSLDKNCLEEYDDLRKDMNRTARRIVIESL